MKDLSKHIEYLLWEHDCVVIPEFGALVANMETARYIAGEELYLPPYRSVRFVSEIKEDDGKLQSCLVKLHHVNTSVAQKWIKEYVTGLNTTLLQEGEMDFGTIGTLYLEDGKYTFASCEAGVNSPTLYGLDSFRFKRIPNAVVTPTEQDPRNITIRISRRKMRIISSLAACLILACMILVPTRGIITSQRSASPISFNETWNTMVEYFNKQTVFPQNPHKRQVVSKQQVKKVKKAEKTSQKDVLKREKVLAKKEKKFEPVEKKLEIKSNQVQAQEVKAEEPTGFCIVMASAIPERYADAYVETLKQNGYANASKIIRKNMIRVILTGYSSQEEANESARRLRGESEDFANIWVMELK